jgi:hypothetical protein
MLSLSSIQSISASTLLSAGAVVFVGIYVILFSGRYQFPSKSPKLVKEGYPIVGALRFFTARWDFFQDASAQSPTGNFSFFLGKYPVVGLSGEKSRQVFFESRDLGFAEGYIPLPIEKTSSHLKLIYIKLRCPLRTIPKQLTGRQQPGLCEEQRAPWAWRIHWQTYYTNAQGGKFCQK